MRDDFSDTTKRLLATRVSNRCSNPSCRAPTGGPQLDPTKALNVGVAAHISGAASGGPRYKPDLTAEERSAPENGIWLCQNCGKLVDNDTLRFPEALLREWKRGAENSALSEIGRTSGVPRPVEEKWVSAAYIEKTGIALQLQSAGYKLIWAGADVESERVDAEGWERVLLDSEAGKVVLKIADPSVAGGYLVLLRKIAVTTTA